MAEPGYLPGYLLEYARMIARENGLDESALVQAVQSQGVSDTDQIQALATQMVSGGGTPSPAPAPSGDGTPAGDVLLQNPTYPGKTPTNPAISQEPGPPLLQNPNYPSAGIAANDQVLGLPNTPAGTSPTSPVAGLAGTPQSPSGPSTAGLGGAPAGAGVDPSIASAAKQPSNIPTVGQANPNDKTPYGMKGVRSAAFGTIPAGEMNKQENGYFFPFYDPSLGGVSQASRNMAMDMGLSPQSGNPYSTYIEGLIPGFAGQADVMSRLGGQIAPDVGAMRQQIADAISSGKTSLVDDVGGTIGRLLEVAKGTGGGAALSGLRGDLADPEMASSIVQSLAGGSVSPFLQKRMANALKQMLMEYRSQAPGNPKQGPFEYLTQGYR